MFEHYDLVLLPKKIAEVRLDLLHIGQEINDQQVMQAQILADIDLTIAADATLTNDAKRKAARNLATAENKEFLAVQANLRVLHQQQAKAQIEVDFYRDELKVALVLAEPAGSGREYAI